LWSEKDKKGKPGANFSNEKQLGSEVAVRNDNEKCVRSKLTFVKAAPTASFESTSQSSQVEDMLPTAKSATSHFSSRSHKPDS